jgi:hypothetical protein
MISLGVIVISTLSFWPWQPKVRLHTRFAAPGAEQPDVVAAIANVPPMAGAGALDSPGEQPCVPPARSDESVIKGAPWEVKDRAPVTVLDDKDMSLAEFHKKFAGGHRTNL